jgi:DNA-binding CsgD family transcriptional regulator
MTKIPAAVCTCGGEHLTPREIDVLVRIAAGMRASQIASCLYISRRTVEYHIARMLRLIGAENATQAVSWCYAVGVLLPLKWPPQWSGQLCLAAPDPRQLADAEMSAHVTGVAVVNLTTKVAEVPGMAVGIADAKLKI